MVSWKKWTQGFSDYADTLGHGFNAENSPQPSQPQSKSSDTQVIPDKAEAEKADAIVRAREIYAKLNTLGENALDAYDDMKSLMGQAKVGFEIFDPNGKKKHADQIHRNADAMVSHTVLKAVERIPGEIDSGQYDPKLAISMLALCLDRVVELDVNSGPRAEALLHASLKSARAKMKAERIIDKRGFSRN